MIDNLGRLWLIEINTNPCLELSSPLLEKLIPRMLSNNLLNNFYYIIDDAFRLTLDKLCNPVGNSKDKAIPVEAYDFLSDFHVPGYDNEENLW